MIWLIVRCLTHQGTTVSVVRKTLTAARRSVLRDFKEIMIDMGRWNERNFKKGEFIYYFENGSWIEFFGADNEQKLRGSKRKILYVNEGNELTYIEWQQLQMRTTAFSIIDYNPSFTDDHWICQLNREKDTFHFISTYKDNPFLEKKVIDEIESLQWKNPSLWRVYGLGLQAIIEGLIFENIEYVDEIPHWAKKRGYVGIDYGYTHDPTAACEVWIYGDEIWIDEIFYNTEMLSSDIIRGLKEHRERCMRNFKIISESADPRLIDEIYNAGLDIHAVQKYPGSVMAGIQKMQEFKIKITKRSSNAIKEFKNYTYRQDKEGRWLNEPVDAFNHCFAADTLIITDQGNKRIDSIKTGDMVLTSQGYRPVGKIFIHRRQKIYVVTLFFGNFALEIRATPNHLFKTNTGWKELSKLTRNDVLYLHSSLMEKNTICTKGSGTIPEVVEECTSMYGNTIMARCQKGITFIIKMAILIITVLKIFLHSMLRNILNITLPKRGKKKTTKKKCVVGWITHENLHQSGMVQKKGVSGTGNMRKRLQTISTFAFTPVSTAIKNIAQQISDSISSARIIAKQHIGETVQIKTKKPEFVNSVAKSSPQTSTVESNFVVSRVLENIIIQSEEIADVYDMHIDYCHEYFANGILVHNCIDAIRYVILSEVLGGYGQGMDAEEIVDML